MEREAMKHRCCSQNGQAFKVISRFNPSKKTLIQAEIAAKEKINGRRCLGSL